PTKRFAPDRRKHGDDNQTRLLRTSGSATQGQREGYPHGVSQAGAQIPPRPESGRQGCGRKIQTNPGSLRRALRLEEAADVRPVRLLQRESAAGGLSKRAKRKRSRREL